MADPVIEATRKVLSGICSTLRGVVDGLPAEALNWLPASDEDSNTITVQATHGLSATRYLLGFALGESPGRDRDEEFAAMTQDALSLMALIDSVEADCLSLLDGAGDVDWGAQRTRTRSDGSVFGFSAAYAVLHALSHLEGHVNEASLTRHLWLQAH